MLRRLSYCSMVLGCSLLFSSLAGCNASSKELPPETTAGEVMPPDEMQKRMQESMSRMSPEMQKRASANMQRMQDSAPPGGSTTPTP